MINEEPEQLSEQDLSAGELVGQKLLEEVEDPAVRLAVIIRSRISATTRPGPFMNRAKTGRIRRILAGSK